MWNRLNPNWQRAFGLAWESFRNGTVPVGCVIVDKNNKVQAAGRNAIFDLQFSSPLAGTNLAHAEMMALSQLERRKHPHIRSYTCYTTLEPCPMCFGAMVMMNIRNIKYGAKDGVAGALLLKNATPYLKSKALTVTRGPRVLEVFQTVLLTAFELHRNHPRQAEFLKAWRQDCSEGVGLGVELYNKGYFTQAQKRAYPVGKVFLDITLDAGQGGYR